MKRSVLLTGLVILSTTVAAGAALAQRPGDMRGKMMSFEEFDADGNGEITETEMTTYRETRFTRTDTNGDGVLSTEEIVAAGQQRMQERAAYMIERYDTNADGALSLDEMPERGKGKRAGKMFDRIDADDSGSISKAEYDAAMEHRKGRKHRGTDQN